jgi:hypothetical protein
VVNEGPIVVRLDEIVSLVAINGEQPFAPGTDELRMLADCGIASRTVLCRSNANVSSLMNSIDFEPEVEVSEETLYAYKRLQNGSDIRGVAVEGKISLS